MPATKEILITALIVILTLKVIRNVPELGQFVNS